MKPFDKRAILAELPASYLKDRLIYLDTTDSTQTVARQLADDGAEEGTVVVANHQSAGRGRMGRKWMAPPGSSLLLTMIFRPRLAPSELHRISMLCSLAILDAVEAESGIRLAIKWPNDVIAWPTPETPGDRKVAGLLAESALSGERLCYCLVGIGMNVNLSPDDLPVTAIPATSLWQLSGRLQDRTSLLCRLLNQIDERYEAEKSGDRSPGRLALEWSTNMATLGRNVVVTAAGGSIEGLAEGVDGDGALRVRGLDGTLHAVRAGDVSLRGSLPGKGRRGAP